MFFILFVLFSFTKGLLTKVLAGYRAIMRYCTGSWSEVQRDREESSYPDQGGKSYRADHLERSINLLIRDIVNPTEGVPRSL